MRYVGLALVCLILGGCAVPLPLSVASFVVGTGSTLSTGKSVPGHLMSFALEQDCAMWHVIKGERICQELPAEEVLAIREQKRSNRRVLLTHDEERSFESPRLAWVPDRNGGDGGSQMVASAANLDGDALPAVPTIAGPSALQLAARPGPEAGAPMYLLAPAYAPPSPVIIAEAAEDRKGQAVRAPSIDPDSSADSDLPAIPVLPAPSAGRAANVTASGGADPESAIGDISAMIARTAEVDAAGFVGAGIEIPPDQKKVEFTGRAEVLTVEDPEIARRLDAIKRMKGPGSTPAAATEVASLQPPAAPALMAAAGPSEPAAQPAPALSGLSPEAGKALEAIISQGAPEAGVAAVPSPAGQSDPAEVADSPSRGESGIDKVKSLFAPKRQTVFGQTLVSDDGLPAVPPLAAPAKPDDAADPVELPAELAKIAPALGGAAVAPPAADGNDPSSAYVEPAESTKARQLTAADNPIKNLPSITAMVVPSWQPMPDRQKLAAVPLASGASWPADGPTAVMPGRYLIIGSFLKKANAEDLAARRQDISAAIVPTRIKGKTWHRVAVPDRADVRGRVAAAGITRYWVLKM